jgi:hypothetical protein
LALRLLLVAALGVLSLQALVSHEQLGPYERWVLVATSSLSIAMLVVIAVSGVRAYRSS